MPKPNRLRAILLPLAGSLCVAAMIVLGATLVRAALRSEGVFMLWNWMFYSADCSRLPDRDLLLQPSSLALPALFRAKAAIRNLRAKGVLADDAWGAMGANCARLQVAARTHGDPDAVFLIFGDPRVGRLTSFDSTASGSEAVIDNWIQVFQPRSSQERSAESSKR